MSNECDDVDLSATSAPHPSSSASVPTAEGFDKEFPSEGCSPAPSNCSIVSEHEIHEGNFQHRQSPFMAMVHASPNPHSCHPRPEFLNSSIADSETSSRSSLDGSFLSKESSEGMEKFRTRRCARKLSSSSSDSEGSELTVGGGSIDGDEPIVRKQSKSKVGDSALPVARRLDAPRGRIANIRRESDCSLNNEVEHERLVKTSQQVSCGFDDISLETASTMEARRRVSSASSVGDPISIVTNVFLPHSCSPSPTRIADMHKQCYSPSTHQMVRPNMPYSGTPSPTQSPTRQQLLRSLSPITTKTALKRRYAASDEVESKRSCGGGGVSGVFVRNSTSPLVTDRTFPYSTAVTQEFVQPSSISVNWSSPSAACSRRNSTLDNILERRSSAESVSDEQKASEETSTPPAQTSDPLSEVDALESSLTSEQDTERNCEMCDDVRSCAMNSSAEESQSVQNKTCPYEHFLRS